MCPAPGAVCGVDGARVLLAVEPGIETVAGGVAVSWIGSEDLREAVPCLVHQALLEFGDTEVVERGEVAGVGRQGLAIGLRRRGVIALPRQGRPEIIVRDREVGRFSDGPGEGLARLFGAA